MERIEGGTILSVPGWRGAAVAAGLKASGGLDLVILQAQGPRTAAGVFTRNALKAAPVTLCQAALGRAASARTIVINAGIANAMTGAEGDETAAAMAARAEALCGGPALVLSTGRIGVPIPRDLVLTGIERAAGALAASAEAGQAVAQAILTTDTRAKTTATRVSLPAHAGDPTTSVTVAGVAKGSGMIHPDMATMLAVVTTDAPVAARALDRLLRRAVDQSFHEITVDGDTSTNDSVLLLAGGAALLEIGDEDPRLAALEAAITAVMQQLAQAIVHDGEGVTRVMELRVTGARDAAEARRVAESVARSPLVKTALAGGDPNWGRILAAAANAGVPLAAEALTLDLGGVRVFAGGLPLAGTEAAAGEAFRERDVLVELALGRGAGAARLFTADLTRDYVRINADYTT